MRLGVRGRIYDLSMERRNERVMGENSGWRMALVVFWEVTSHALWGAGGKERLTLRAALRVRVVC